MFGVRSWRLRQGLKLARQVGQKHGQGDFFFARKYSVNLGTFTNDPRQLAMFRNQLKQNGVLRSMDHEDGGETDNNGGGHDKGVKLDGPYSVASFLMEFEERRNDSLMECEKACQLEPEDSVAHFCKALALYNLNRFEEALHTYDKALKFDKRDKRLRPEWVQKSKDHMEAIQQMLEEEGEIEVEKQMIQENKKLAKATAKMMKAAEKSRSKKSKKSSKTSNNTNEEASQATLTAAEDENASDVDGVDTEQDLDDFWEDLNVLKLEFDDDTATFDDLSAVDSIHHVHFEVGQMGDVIDKISDKRLHPKLRTTLLKSLNIMEEQLEHTRDKCDDMELKITELEAMIEYGDNGSVVATPQQQQESEETRGNREAKEFIQVKHKALSTKWNQLKEKLAMNAMILNGESEESGQNSGEALILLGEMKDIQAEIKNEKQLVTDHIMALNVDTFDSFDQINRDVDAQWQELNGNEVIDSFEQKWRDWDIEDTIKWFDFVLKSKHESGDYSQMVNSGLAEGGETGYEHDSDDSDIEHDIDDSMAGEVDFENVRNRMSAMEFRARRDFPLKIRETQFRRYGFKNRTDRQLLFKQIQALMTKYPKRARKIA